MFRATINRETLTDGSHVFRVALTDGGEHVAEFDAITERDAEKLASKIISALGDHALLEVAARHDHAY